MKRNDRHTAKGRVRTRANAGFTLVELMVVAAIMVLAAVIVATGMPSAFRAYTAASDASNAQVMLSTTTTRLRDVLSSADPNAAITSAGTSESGGSGDHELVTFDSLETGYTTTIKWNAALGLYMTESSSADDVVAPGETSPASGGFSVTTPFVPVTTDGGSGPRLHTEATSITYEDGAFVIQGLKVVRDDGVNLANAEVNELRVYPIVR